MIIFQYVLLDNAGSSHICDYMMSQENATPVCNAALIVLLQCVHDGSVCGLWAVVSVKQERVGTRSPRVLSYNVSKYFLVTKEHQVNLPDL